MRKHAARKRASRADAFGQGVWAHHRGEEAVEIVERNDGYIGLTQGPKAYFQPFSEWLGFEQRAMDFAKGRVLDAGAGAGRVALHLQERGLRVTAIDTSPLAIRVCRQRGVKDAKVMPIAEAARRWTAVFDTIVLWGGNFGLLENPSRAKRLLARLHRASTADALILAESVDPYHRNTPPQLSHFRSGKKTAVWAGQLRMRLRFRDYSSGWFDYLLVSKKEMRAVLEGTGWRVRSFLEGGRPVYAAVIAKE